MRSAHYNFCFQTWIYFLLFDKQGIVLRALIPGVSFFSRYQTMSMDDRFQWFGCGVFVLKKIRIKSSIIIIIKACWQHRFPWLFLTIHSYQPLSCQFLSLFKIILTLHGLFNSKVILIEEHCWGDMRFLPFPRALVQKWM